MSRIGRVEKGEGEGVHKKQTQSRRMGYSRSMEKERDGCVEWRNEGKEREEVGRKEKRKYMSRSQWDGKKKTKSESPNR